MVIQPVVARNAEAEGRLLLLDEHVQTEVPKDLGQIPYTIFAHMAEGRGPGAKVLWPWSSSLRCVRHPQHVAAHEPCQRLLGVSALHQRAHDQRVLR